MTKRPLICVTPGAFPEVLRQGLELAGWELVCITDLRSAARTMRAGHYRLGLLYAERLESTHCGHIEALFKADRACEWVGLFSQESQQSAECVDLILGYLFDYHTLPVNLPHLLHTLGHAFGRSALHHSAHVAVTAVEKKAACIIGQSPSIKALLGLLRRVAVTDAPVLIGGESGSGKELAAQAVHQFSKRHAGPFVAVNCGAIAGTLIQAELFGAVRGSYTGATRDRKGLIESAQGGTLFLDEIADLPLELQINLLRFLQEKTITPVGSATTIPIDVRVVTAANVDLQVAVNQGQFRQDLYYRLNVVPLLVPPLRERREDIPLLAHHFFTVHEGERHSRLRGFSSAALRAMMAYDWPGNVRELINRVRRAMVMAEGRMITPADLGLAVRAAPPDPLGQVRTAAEREAVCRALAHSRSNVTHAARELGVSRMTLYRMIDRHQITLGAPCENERIAFQVERRTSPG